VSFSRRTLLHEVGLSGLLLDSNLLSQAYKFVIGLVRSESTLVKKIKYVRRRKLLIGM
jgi:hypothetical protein